VRESGPVGELLSQPRDLYTKNLMASAPSITHALATVGVPDGSDQHPRP